MSVQIPDSHKVLFERPIVAVLATVMPDGRPQVNPVWCDYDGTFVRVNSAQGRQKDKNMKRRKFATILVVDPNNPFFWVEVRGRVAEISTTDADAHIDSLSKKYLGQDTYPYRVSNEVRVIYKILPERVVTSV